MEDLFNLTKSVKILTSEKFLSKKKLKEFFEKVCNGKQGNFLDKQDNIDVDGLRYSYRVFKKSVEPSFLNGSNLKEIKYGYCLITQYSGYIMINSRYCLLNNDNLKLIGSLIPSNQFSNLVITDNDEYQKISLKNTSVISRGIKNRSIDGEELEKVFSPIYASKNIVKSYKIKNQYGIFSQNINTARLTNYGSRDNLSNYLSWCRELIDIIKANEVKSSYLNNFCQSVSYQEESKDLIPDSIMFDFNYIRDLCPIFYNEARQVDEEEIFHKYNGTFELIQIPDKENYFGLKNGNEIDIKVIKLKDKIKISVPNDYSYKLEDGIDRKFEELLTSNAIITFSEPKFSYYANVLYVDDYLVNNNSAILKNFFPLPGLEKTTSEKGKINLNSDSFDDMSVFNVLEKYLEENYDYVFCDDLGDEIADYIACSENTIGFFHAKSSKRKFSASAFQEVIGQAIKNLSYICDTKNITLDKADTESSAKTKSEVWSRNYKNDNVTTKITRLRKPSGEEGVEERVSKGIKVLKEANSSGQTIRYVGIVVNFISKSQLEREIDNNNNKQLKQILWIISSFISTCQELNVIPKVFCKE